MIISKSKTKKRARKSYNRGHISSRKSKRGINRVYNKLKGGDITTKGGRKAIVCVLDSAGGFFAVYHTLIRAYLYAKKLNVPFFIEHDNWQYTYKDGWHDYFKSLNILNKEDHYDEIERFKNGARNDIMDKFTNADIVQAIKETFILQDYIQSSIDSYIKEIGDDYTSLYVRRGDKASEVAFMSLDDIIAQTTIKDDGGKIFVQTDDFSIVKDMRNKLPSCKIMTLTKENAAGSTNSELHNWTPEQRKEHVEELLISCVVTARAKIGWSYYMSNVGTFIKLLSFNNINLYLDEKYASKEEINNIFRLDSTYKDTMDAATTMMAKGKK
jgi:hypothetical protein